MSTPLTAALNGRKGKGKAHVIPVDFNVEPVMLLAEEPRPAVEVSTGPRELRAGEVGHRSGPVPVEYTEAALRAALARTAKGCTFVSEHLNDAQGFAQLGLLVELAEDLDLLLRMHMVKGVLNGHQN